MELFFVSYSKIKTSLQTNKFSLLLFANDETRDDGSRKIEKKRYNTIFVIIIYYGIQIEYFHLNYWENLFYLVIVYKRIQAQ